jgi:hypothetical protein
MFRLSESEYRALRETCALSGSRSISAFTRSVTLARVSQIKGGPGLADTDLEARVAQLESEIRALIRPAQPNK